MTEIEKHLIFIPLLSTLASDPLASKAEHPDGWSPTTPLTRRCSGKLITIPFTQHVSTARFCRVIAAQRFFSLPRGGGGSEQGSNGDQVAASHG